MQDGDAVALFRDEIVSVPMRIRWREGALSDETRFAAAASGLSWRPSWNDKPLILSEKKGHDLSYGDGVDRLNGFVEARRQSANKIAFAYAFSVVLHPPELDSMGWSTAFNFLRPFGSDFDKALVGVVASPDKLPLLADYRYAAADALLYRVSPRLLPFFLGLAQSDDRYLRSRGVAGLGLIAYRTDKTAMDTVRGLLVEPRELGISAVQIGMIDEIVQKAAEDKDYRVRSAAALALGLIGGEESQTLLQKMIKDRAYIRQETGDKSSAAVTFPVRVQAARSLERLGERNLNDGSGLYDAKTIGKATRGGQNITKDAMEGKKKVEHSIRFHDGDW
jgi:hypothetical protein